MYLSQSDQVILLLNVQQLKAKAALIKGTIERDRTSEKKRDMGDGVRYYDAKHDILNKDFRKYLIDGTEYIDEDAANNRVPNPFHQELVDHKAEYILSNQVSITSDNEKLKAKIEDFANDYFFDTLNNLTVNASNKGLEWIHYYVNNEGEFDYIIIPAEEIIPDYDASFKRRLNSVLRYYKVDKIVDDSGKFKSITKVEIWSDVDVEYFIETEKGDFIRDPEEEVNPKPHWSVKFKQGEKIVSSTSRSFGVPPFIKLQNNNSEKTDLKSVKPLIDVYDLIFSGFANNIEDIQDAIWNLKEFEGTDLKEFMTNMRKYKAIKTSGTGGVEPHTLEIPVDAKNKLLEIIEANIYRFGRGVNMSDENFDGDQSGVAIQYKYSRLDLKANAIIKNLKTLIRELFRAWMKFQDNGFKMKDKDLKITFSKAMLTNIKEQIENCQNSIGIISEETVLENHPFVKDTEKEIERKKAESNPIDLTGDEPV